MKEKFKSFTENHAEIWKFIKFSFTGVSTSLLDIAVFSFLFYVVFRSMNQTPVTDNAVLDFLGIKYKGYMYAYFISTTLSYIASYIMNRKLTFKSNSNLLLSTVLFAIMVVVTIAFSTWFGAFLGTLIKDAGYENVFTVLLTKLAVMLVPMLWTYPLQRFVIYKNKAPAEEPLTASAAPDVDPGQQTADDHQNGAADR